MSKKVAIFQFPGSNCEYETLESVRAVGLEADIVAWTSSEESILSYDAYVLPGGFSFQDRVRAGVVSSKLPLMKSLVKAAKLNKPILGICNGCQILAESGLVPDHSETQDIEMALAPNMKNSDFYGFICDWVYVKIKHPKQNVFTKLFSDDDVIPIQVNHGEGNFQFKENETAIHDKQTHIQYCDEDGHVSEQASPNGAALHTAGLSNKKGNILAIMPHPERGAFAYQVPRYLNHKWGDIKRNDVDKVDGPWHKLFLSLANHLNKDKS